MILHQRTWGDGTTTTTDPSTTDTSSTGTSSTTDPTQTATDAATGAAIDAAQVLAIQQNADAMAAATTTASWNLFLGMLSGSIITIGVMFAVKKYGNRRIGKKGKK